MKKKNTQVVEDENTNDMVFLAKIIFGGVLVMGLLTTAGFVGYQFWQSWQVSNLKNETLELAEIAQKYVDIEKRFNPQLDTSLHGSKYISSILPKNYQGAKLEHSLEGEIVVGRSGMSGKANTELFITLKDIPGEKRCVNLVRAFDATIPVIAVGESGDNIGMDTGMFVKSNYAQRVLSQEHLEATCFSLSQKTGKVNVTIWITADTQILTKNTVPGTKTSKPIR